MAEIAKLSKFEKLTGIKINKKFGACKSVPFLQIDASKTHVECGEYYNKTNKVPPVNLYTWVPVYNIVTGAGFGKV